jgi:hypothetical protein
LFILLTDSAFDNPTCDADRLSGSVSIEGIEGVEDEDRIKHSSEDTLLLLSNSILSVITYKWR